MNKAHLSVKKAARMAQAATQHHVVPGHKTWNVYVQPSKRSKSSFLWGLLLGAAGVIALGISKSQTARDQLNDKLSQAQEVARSKASEVVEKAKPVVQQVVDKTAEKVTDAADTVRDSTETATAKTKRTAAHAQGSVEDKLTDDRTA